MIINNITEVRKTCKLCNLSFIPVKKEFCKPILNFDYLCFDCNITMRRYLINKGFQTFNS